MTAAEIAKFRTEIAAAKAAWSRDPASSVVAGKLGRPLTAPVASIGTWCVNGPATRICWSAETADDDGPERATVIDATGAKIAEFDLGETAEDSPTDLFLSEDGKRLVAADWIGCSVAVYDVPTGKELWRKRQPDSGDLEADLDEEWLATPVAPASVALVKGGRSVEILDVETGAVRRRWTETEDVVHICAAGTSRLVLAQESSVTMIDTETGKRIWSTPSPSSSPDDGYDWVVAGSEGGPVLADRGMIGHGSVDALDPATGARLWTLAGIGSIDAVSRSGRLGAVFGRPPLIVDLSNGRVLGRVTLSEPAELFEKYEFGADERSLLVRRGAADGELIVPVALDLPAPLPATPGGK